MANELALLSDFHNVFTLMKIKKDAEELAKNYTFKMDSEDRPPSTLDYDVNGCHIHADFPAELDYPNEDELREWMKDYLRGRYFSQDVRGGMTRQTYNSLKGEIVRRNYIDVFNYFSNRGFYIKEAFEKYRKSKVINRGKAEITFPPTKLVTIDIDVNVNVKGEN